MQVPSLLQIVPAPYYEIGVPVAFVPIQTQEGVRDNTNPDK